jgi:O-antigen ligase
MSKPICHTLSGNEDRFGFGFMTAFLVSLPYDRFFNQLILAGWLCHVLIHSRAGYWKRLLHPYFWLVGGIFWIGLLAMSYTPYARQGWSDVGKQVAFVMLPLIFSLSHYNWRLYANRALGIFSLSLGLLILFLYGHALYTLYYFKLPLAQIFSPAFTNHRFAEPIGMHATFLSLYLAMGLFYCLRQLLQRQNAAAIKGYGLLLVILLGGLLQLASKTILIAFMVALYTGFLFMVPPGRTKKIFMAALLFFSLGFMALVWGTGFGRERFVEGWKTDFSTTRVYGNKTEPRVQRWVCAWELYKEAPVLGHGTGSEKIRLKEKYYEKKYYLSFLQEFDAHNVYLSLLIRYGLPGLFIFLLILVIAFKRSLAQKDPVFFSFLCLLVIGAFTENITESNKGIFFLAFFLSFFMLRGNETNPGIRFGVCSTKKD